MEKSLLPAWASEMPEGAFISNSPTYEVGKYFSLFSNEIYEVNDENIKQLKYYFYDPTEHGYSSDGKYPLIVFLHGSGNALEGDVCINYTGAEFFATEKYQKALGGAYLLIPIANEHRDEEGKTCGGWDTAYDAPVYELIENFVKKNTGKIGKKFLMGNSRGASFTFELGNAYTGYFDGLIPIGTSAIPSDEKLDEYEEKGVNLFFATGKRDEFNNFKEEIEPRIEKLKSMKHCFCFTPEWVYNGDGGIASINVGIEMGQHCLINAMHINLMLDNGKPMYDYLPDGIIGWMNKVIAE